MEGSLASGMQVFFMHIPKTAGTSFRRFLERSMRERGALVSRREKDGIWSETSESYASYDEFVSDRGAGLRRFDLVCGHYPFHVARLLSPDAVVITVLRDPLARCLSHIKHQMGYERQTVGWTEPDVNAFLAARRNEMFLQTIGNLAVKYLSGSGHPDALVEERGLSLDTAVAHCFRMRFGFADELPAFQRRLARELFGGAGAEIPLGRENRSEDPFAVADLSPRNRDYLRRLNELDLLLDELMRQVLDARAGFEVQETERPVEDRPGGEA
jgi:hypothetical protein